MKIQVYGWSLHMTNDCPNGVAKTQEELKTAFREMRECLLKESDWTQLPDAPLTPEVKTDWLLWRQYMRDMPGLLPEPMTYTIEFNDPPEFGRPPTWDNWDLERGATPYGINEI